MDNNDTSGSLHQALQQEVEALEQSLSGVIKKEQELQEGLKLLLLEKRRYQALIDHAKALLLHKEGRKPPVETRPSGQVRAHERLSAFTPSPEMAARHAPERASNSPRGSLERRINAGESIANAVHSILKETEHSPGEPGVPIHYRDLVTELENKGINISGRDPGLNLVAYIHKDERFFRPKRGMYGLKEWYPHMRHNVGSRTSSRSSRSIQS